MVANTFLFFLVSLIVCALSALKADKRFESTTSKSTYGSHKRPFTIKTKQFCFFFFVHNVLPLDENEPKSNKNTLFYRKGICWSILKLTRTLKRRNNHNIWRHSQQVRCNVECAPFSNILCCPVTYCILYIYIFLFFFQMWMQLFFKWLFYLHLKKNPQAAEKKLRINLFVASFLHHVMGSRISHLNILLLN